MVWVLVHDVATTAATIAAAAAAALHATANCDAGAAWVQPRSEAAGVRPARGDVQGHPAPC